MCRMIVAIAFSANCLLTATTFGQSTSITYQGQLKQAGAPAGGSFSLDFSLWDADVDGNLVGGPLNRPDTPVTNGLFNVLLDFPPEVFTGARLWLEVIVDGVPLTPRQEITPVPYALSVPGLAMSPTGVEVSGDVHATGDVIASAFSSNSPLIFKVNPANVEVARFDDVNYFFGVGTAAPQARLHIGGVAGQDGLMFPDGSIQTTAAGLGGGGAGFWSPNGSNIFNNNGGNVGIGTTTPHHRLRISGGPPWTSFSWGGALELDNASAIGWRSNAAGNRFGIGQSSGGLYFFATLSDPGTTGNPANYLMTFNDAGNVGIGTTTPASKLDIRGVGTGVELLRFTTERPWVFRQIYSGPSTGLQLYSTAGQKPFEITAVAGENVATFFADGPNSRVGIGTTLPLSKLDIAAVGAGAELLRFSTERPWVFRQIYSGPSTGLQLYSTAGQKPFEITAVNGENVATFMADGANSRVGIGTTGPTSRLDVVGYTGDAIHGTHLGSSLTAAVSGASFGVDGNGVIGRADVGNNAYGVWGQSASGTGGYFTGGTYALVADGRAKVDILEIAGADVAEKFLSSDDNVEPGTVMEIDPENPGKLRVAREAYSTRVAGVVSGAGDIPVGAILGNLPGHEDAPAIALSGRVWVRCDASKTPIAPGDMLTSSDTPGHAMKAADRARAYGTILGKSMTALAQGECGLVLVLVNLQ